MSLVLAGLYVKLSDEDGAYKAYRAVIAIEPGNPVAVRGGALLGAEMSSWDEAVAAVLGLMKARERFDDQLLRELEEKAVAQGGNAIDSYVRAVDAALPKAGLPNAIASQVYLLTASWHRDRRNDVTAAITNFRRGLELGGDRASTLTELAALERDQAGRRRSCSRPCAGWRTPTAPISMSLVGAAEVAGQHRRSRRRCRAARPDPGARDRRVARHREGEVERAPPDAVANWAIESLVELHRAAGRARAAVDHLVEAARLPFDDASKRDLRLRAAQLAR